MYFSNLKATEPWLNRALCAKNDDEITLRYQYDSAKGYEHLIEAHKLIGSRMSEGEWVLDSGYTVLDPYLLVFYRWGHRMNLPMRENCEKIK